MSSSQFEAFVGKTRRRIEPIDWFLAAALFIALAAAWPLISQSGFLNTRGGGDSPFLLQRVQQLGLALADGHFPVRWMPDASYGYGYPFFNFYAPLSIYIASLINLLGVSLVWAVKFAQLLGFITGAWAMFALGRRWFGSSWAGLLSSAAYTLAPFHMVNVYVRGDSLAEFWAMAFYPAAILAADNLARALRAADRKRIIPPVLLLGASMAALVLSHNISALIFTPFLLLYIVLVLIFNQDGQKSGNGGLKDRLSAIIWFAVALTAGLLLSAWFWLPAIAERTLAQLDPVTSGYFHFSNHFRGVDLVQPSFVFNYDAAGGSAFSMGLLQAITILAGVAAIIYYHWRRSGIPNAAERENRLTTSSVLFMVITLIAATIMITTLSEPLWEALPFLEFTQFPWRFLSVQAFAASLMVGGLALLPWRKIIVPTMALLILISAMAGLQPDFIHLAEEDLSPQSLAQYEWFTANIGSTVSAEYLPDTVVPRPFTSSWLNSDNRDAATFLQGDGNSIELVNRGASRQTWQSKSSSPGGTAVLPLLYWPGWKAEVDGENVVLGLAPGSGMMTLELPAGEHEIEIELGRTPVRWLGEIFSLLTLTSMAVLAIWSGAFKWWKSAVIAVLAVLFIAAIGLLLPSPTGDGDTRSWDFAQLSYLHPSPKGIPFDDGSLLKSYSYDQDTVSPGDDLAVKLTWNTPPDGRVSLDLVTPAVNRFPQAPPLVSLSLPTGERESTTTLSIPENAPAGLYLPRLGIDGAAALTSSGNRRGSLFLGPVLIGDASLPSEGEDSPLDVRAVQVQHATNNSLELQLQWLTRGIQTQNFNFSLRLVDSHGSQVAQFDNQPGYGYLPSSLWNAGHWVNDWLALPLPPDLLSLETSAPFSLVARLYEVGTREVVLVRRLGTLEWAGDELRFGESEANFIPPTPTETLDVTFGELVSAVGLDVVTSSDRIDVIMHWQAVDGIVDDYRHFVHLIDPVTGDIVAQHDAMPLFDTYPTSQWSAGEFVSDPAVLDLTNVPPGSYQLAFGLYQDLGLDSEPNRFERLSAMDGEANRLKDDAVIFSEPVVIDR